MSKAHASSTVHWQRILGFLLGATSAAIGGFAAYDYAVKLEGGTVSYLVIAAPVVATSAAILPIIVERAWMSGEYIKGFVTSLLIIPAMATVYLSTVERLETVKSPHYAQSAAAQSAIERASVAVEQARSAYSKAGEAYAKAGGKNCGETRKCNALKTSLELTETEIAKAEARLNEAQKANSYRAPNAALSWLLPFVIDGLAFVGLWLAFSGPWITRNEPTVTAKRKTAPRPRPTSPKVKAPKSQPMVRGPHLVTGVRPALVVGNDNHRM